MPAISGDSRASDEIPEEIRELRAAHHSAKAMFVDNDEAKRHMLPPKESGITLDMLTHRITTDRSTGEVLDICFVMFGQPENGCKTMYLNTLHTPVDTRTWFLWSPEMKGPAQLQAEFVPGGSGGTAAAD